MKRLFSLLTLAAAVMALPSCLTTSTGIGFTACYDKACVTVNVPPSTKTPAPVVVAPVPEKPATEVAAP